MSAVSRCIPGWVVSRRMSIRMPDGTMRSQKLPDARRVAIGKKANFALAYQGHLFVFWMQRVKGGWQIDRQTPSTASVPSRENASQNGP